jgi:hypothetical protein
MVPLVPETERPPWPAPDLHDETRPLLSGVLRAYVAFDWGEEVDLARARTLVPAREQELPRRRRTPTSIAYRPPPLCFQLAPVHIELAELGSCEAAVEATVFDFAAVSVALHLPFSLSTDALLRLACSLADPTDVMRAARTALEPLHARLRPAVLNPLWKDDLSEEYFVFHLLPGEPVPPTRLVEAYADWLAGLVRLESGPLSGEEVTESLRLLLRYSPEDLFIADWAAAVLCDRNCEETLQTVEFANVQLLEFRHIDDRLDDQLEAAYRTIRRLAKSGLPFWRSHGRSLRLLGELRVEANTLFERTGNVLKLVGDQYLARVYRLLARRLHLREWEQSIQRKLDVVEGVYQVVSDQTDTYRAEFLEIAVVMLIILEVVLALLRH